ncbi:uncharacterized protein LOC143146075 [Ptiloglossa arizonensis]|uniref:uncharacterized protein LOC143146075 n=1 Tax=Ptiloglossa arizonensis TaxID=3350558 RepID=UPI003FA0AADF
MGYYASGDTRKTIHSSEDEGYENQSPHTTISFELQSQSNIIDKSNFSFGKSEGISSVSIPPTTDETDRSFWAEDELSSSESRQQLNKKQKRRHSFSYRNRIAVHRSRFLFFQSSSSMDSISGQISSKVLKQEKYNRCTGRFGVEQLQPGCSVTKKKYVHKKVPSFLINNQNVYSRCKKSMHAYTRKRNSFLTNKKVRRKSCSSSSGNSSQNHFDSLS